MKAASECYTLEEINRLIDEIDRDVPLLRAQAASCEWSTAERAADHKLNAMCTALERRIELEEEIRTGTRDPRDGSITIQV